MDFQPYAPRPVSLLEVWDTGLPSGGRGPRQPEGAVDVSANLRLKVYGISYLRPRPREELIRAAKEAVSVFLRVGSTRHATYGLGFLGIHDGRTENQVFLDRWCNENELLHTTGASPVENPMDLKRTGWDHNSVCVWDLAVQCFERQAWVKHMLTGAAGPDPAAYLAAHLSGEV